MATRVRSNVQTIEDVRRALAQIVNESARWATAWCQFNGVQTGTNPPNEGYNVLSIQRISIGTYDVTFENPMPNVNYAVLVTANDTNFLSCRITSANLSFFRIIAETATSTAADSDAVNVAVFGPRG